MQVSVEALNKDTLLAPKAKASYLNRVNWLISVINENSGRKRDIEWIMLHPSETIKTIQSKISTNPLTIANYITVICKLYALHAQFANVHQTENNEYLEALRKYRQDETKRYKKNDFTDKQVKNLVSWQEVQDRFCELQRDPKVTERQKENQEYLLFAFFLNMYPKRADYGCVRIYQSKPSSSTKGNYIYFEPKPMLVLNEYKTAGHHGAIQEPIPMVLAAILEESLELFPRDYLFVSVGTNNPFNNDSYSHFVKRVFKKHFNRPMGVSLWRSVYIAANLDFQEDSNETLDKAAYYIGHTQSALYNLYKKTGDKAKAMRRPVDEKKEPVVCKNN